jgi:membrane associated rhomboid family serine protease
MGIYDRDYYREGPSYLESLIPSGRICKWLIGVNIVVFIIQLATPPHAGIAAPTMGWFTDHFWLTPEDVRSGEVWRLLTYAFLHHDFWHIFFNMLFLWWFGSDIEVIYGPREFLSFYLVAAFAGGLLYEACFFVTHNAQPCLGASGAVTALLVLNAWHFPGKIIYVMFMLPVPIWLFAVFNVGWDAYRLVGELQHRNWANGVAVSVHVAGAAFATAYYKMHWRVYDFLFGWWGQLPKRRSRPRLRLYRPEEGEGREEPVPVAAASALDAPPVDEHLEAKLDAVLEKLARSGKESLTESERQILMRASEIYKRRRT